MASHRRRDARLAGNQRRLGARHVERAGSAGSAAPANVIRAASDGHLLYRLRHRPGNPVSLASGEVHALLRSRRTVLGGSYGGGVRATQFAQHAFRLRDRLAFAEVDNAPDDLNVRAITVLADGRILWAPGPGHRVLDAQLRPSVRCMMRADGATAASASLLADGALWIGSDAGVFRRATSAPLQSFTGGWSRAAPVATRWR